jgi:hypothetical protein
LTRGSPVFTQWIVFGRSLRAAVVFVAMWASFVSALGPDCDVEEVRPRVGLSFSVYILSHYRSRGIHT